MRVGDDWVEITLINVSQTGLMVRSMLQPAVGSVVEIRRRGLALVGEVVWSTPTRFGVRTSEEVDLTALMARSDLQPDRRNIQRPATTTRRARARWIFWNW
jgi:hypothetical protein